MAAITKRLILLLGEEEQHPIIWCWGDPAEPQEQQSGELAAGETLPDEISASPAIVLIPSHRVILRSTHFPGSSRLASAETLVFQCEEELLQDVEALHWVILGHEGEHYALAGYQRSDMQQWLLLLAQLGIQPTTLLPDVLAFPYQEQPSVHTVRNYHLFRTGKWSGYALPQHWPLEQLDIGYQGFSPVTVSTDRITTDKHPLWECATGKFDKKMTLLQGEFTPPSAWRNSSSLRNRLLGASLSLVLGMLILGGIHYQQHHHAVRQQITQVHHHFFGDKVPPQPLAVMQDQATTLQLWQQQPQFFELAQQLRQALPAQYNNNLHSLNFDAANAELALTFKTLDTTSFSQLNELGNLVSLQKIAGEDLAILTVKETP